MDARIHAAVSLDSGCLIAQLKSRAAKHQAKSFVAHLRCAMHANIMKYAGYLSARTPCPATALAAPFLTFNYPARMASKAWA